MPLSIAFAGASGTGKTTLARYASELLFLPVTPIDSRSVALGMGFESAYDVDRADRAAYEEAQRAGEGNTSTPRAWALEAIEYGLMEEGEPSYNMRPVFQTKLQADKIEWETAAAADRGFVSDRSSLDDCAYAMVHAPAVADRAFIERAVKHTRNLDFLFVCPMSSFQSIGDDPARVADLDYHVRYEIVLRGLLSTLHEGPRRLKRVVFIDEKERDERLTRVRQVVGPL